MVKGETWKNKRSSMQYKVAGIVRDTTTATNGRHMVAYYALANRDEVFVREVTEWREKFEKVG